MVSPDRTSGSALDGRGRLVDVSAVFTQYGGAGATNVGPVAGGPFGRLITGNRMSGPGVWVTNDPRGFTRAEGDPGLTDDGRDWRQVVVPLTPETAGDHTLAVADGDGPLLVADAGEGGEGGRGH